MGTTSGLGGFPRGSNKTDVRTRRALRRLAGVKLQYGYGLTVGNDGSLGIDLAVLDTVFAQLGAANVFIKAPQVIKIDADAHDGLDIWRHSSGQSSPFLTFKDETGVTLYSVGANGNYTGNAANVTGTVLVAHGGTGDVSLTAYGVLIGGTTSTGALQSVAVGTSLQILTSNGAGLAPTMQTISGAFFAAQVGNVVFAGPTTNAFSQSPTFRALVALDLGTGTADNTKYLRGDLTWQTTASGTVTSVSGSGGTTGLTLTGGAITTSGTLTLGGTLVVANGGTGNTSQTAYSLLAGGTTSTGVFQAIAIGTAGRLLIDQGAGALAAFTALSSDATISSSGALTLKNTGTAGTYGQVTTDAQGRVSSGTTCTVANGGTGLATLTAHAVLLGEGTSNVAFAAIGTSGRLLIDQGAGADPAFTAASGAFTITNAGVATLATVGVATGGTGAVSLTAYGVVCGGTTSTGAVQVVAIGTAGKLFVDQGAGALPAFVTMSSDATISSSGAVTLKSVGTAGTYGQVTTDAQGRVSAGATCTVANGGTGVATLTAYGVVCGGTTSTGNVQSVAVGTAGYVLTSNGAGALPSMQAPSGSGGTAGLSWLAAFTAPSTGNYAWLNQGTATDTAGSQNNIVLSIATNDGVKIRGRDKTLANATPYTLTAAMVCNNAGIGTGCNVGIYVRSSVSSKISSLSLTISSGGALQILVEHWTDANTASAQSFLGGSSIGPGLAWFRIADDGTNIIYSISSDGVSWCEVFQEARTTFFSGGNAATNCGYFVESATTTASRGPISLNLLSWLETNP